MREVLPNRLYIGNAMDARDVRLLFERQISAVVDLALNETPAQLSHEMVYCRVPITDGDENSDVVIETAFRTIILLLEFDFRILVACSAGMSRSPAIAAAAIALFTTCHPKDCLLTIMKESSHDVSPALWESVLAVYNQMVGNQTTGTKNV